jgi:protein ImuB
VLWLCLYLPRLPLDAAAAPEDRPFAVCGSDRRVLHANAAAQSSGVRPGQNLAQAQTLCPMLGSVARNAEAERETLEIIAAWAGQFGHPVALDATRPLVWVEIGRSLKLFGGLKSLLDECRKRQRQLSVELRRGIGPGLEASALLASAGFTRPVLSFDRLHKLIMSWPQQRLHLNDAAHRLFAGSGLQRIGQVLELPADSLARRLDPGVPDYLARLSGRRNETWTPHNPPPHYRRRLDLLCEIEHLEGLRFALRRLIHEFCGYLHARDLGVQRFSLQLGHAHRASSRIDLRLLAASRDAAQLLRLTQERLERQPPEAAVQDLLIEASEFLQPDVAQQGLFGEDRALLDLRDVLERIQARLGDASVQKIHPVAEHRPDLSWQFVTPDDTLKTAVIESPPRPLWLLEKPVPVEAPRLRSSPERIEHGWWDTAMRRDYFTAEDAQGRRLWVYREAGDTQWWLHGYWS